MVFRIAVSALPGMNDNVPRETEASSFPPKLSDPASYAENMCKSDMLFCHMVSILPPMDGSTFPRSLLRRAENTELSLGSLEAIAELRRTLDRLEHETVLNAREKGASVEDIAEALDLTPQAVYYRLRNAGQSPRRRGRPRMADLTQEDGSGEREQDEQVSQVHEAGD
jgi:DNA-directed RNA polymerase specialized sigma24 family protein